jgi:hypothetical protein
MWFCGERGIRTPGTTFIVRMFSKHVVSATHPPLLDQKLFENRIKNLKQTLKKFKHNPLYFFRIANVDIILISTNKNELRALFFQ